MLFHSCSCPTSYFEDFTLLTDSASWLLPPSQSVTGTCCFFLQQVCPSPLYFKSLLPQVQLISQAEVSSPPKASSSSVIHSVPVHGRPAPKTFVKLTCSKPYSSMFRKIFCKKSFPMSTRSLTLQTVQVGSSPSFQGMISFSSLTTGHQCLLMLFSPAYQEPFFPSRSTSNPIFFKKNLA